MKRLAVVLKGYPRLSESFIAQEIYGLEQRGFKILIIALRAPHDPFLHEVHRMIRAEVHYLPEYPDEKDARVSKAVSWAQKNANYDRLLELQEHRKTALRCSNSYDDREEQQRFLQACVLAHELPEDVGWLHVHYLHSPCTVLAYSACLLGRPWSFSAHAKDIWTSRPEELRLKLRHASWGVSCTRYNVKYLQELSDTPQKVSLVYHGLKSQDFPVVNVQRSFQQKAFNPPFEIVSVGRLVAKKGYEDLLTALGNLPTEFEWQLTHIGAGELNDELQQLAGELGIDQRVRFLGALPRDQVICHLRKADLFVLACKIAKDGDRDGLPNVIMEAMLLGVPCLSTSISAIPEIIDDGETGYLVPPDMPNALKEAILDLAHNDGLRLQLALNGQRRVLQNFNSESLLDQLATRFERSIGASQ
ncbi:glycosyltransferase family 4 protein [Polycladidibacter stylochi]|uniref:glycosyltransferase family 4 protein n=1 Tax=Polycladidibacter stylochi TaxID=1807766 RepID=UPI000836AD2D|nr:glycosyltransferase family 4 protein [Pseudovibrio stylochi]